MSRKVKAGMDIGKAPTGYATNQDEPQEFGGLTTDRDLLAILRDELLKRGYSLVANPTGAYCGFDVYYNAKIDITGLEPPKDFTFKKRLEISNQIAHNSFLAQLKLVCENQMRECWDEGDKDKAKRWAAIATCFDSKPKNTKTVVFEASYSFQQEDPRKVTLTGLPGYHKVVPPLAWFSKELQDYDPMELLSLFPEAEREMFALLLGRIVVGSKEAVAAEGKLSHGFRSFALIIGQPAMGKSTCMKYIRDTLQKLGFTVGLINGNLTRFGWGDAALADLSYIDDLSKDNQKQLLKSPNLKSLVSNDPFMVEEKGIAAYQVKSQTVVIGCSNHTDPEDFISMDSGSVNRTNQLSTHNKYEFRQLHPDLKDPNAYQLWKSVAARLNCDEYLLTARLLRHCADYFLALSGHTFDEDNYLSKDLAQDFLLDRVEELRETYIIRTDIDHAYELPKLAAKLVTYAIAYEKDLTKRQKLLKAVDIADFDFKLLMVVLDLFANGQDVYKDFPELLPKKISPGCKKSLGQKLADLRHLTEAKSLSQAFTTLVQELLAASSSFGYPQKPSFYQPTWQEARRNIKYEVAEAEARLAEVPETPSRLDVALETLQLTLKELSY